MKILFAIKSMTLPGGGAERILADLVNYLVDKGHEIGLITFDTPHGPDFYPVDERVQRFPLGIGDVHRKARVAETLSRIRAMRELALKENPDVAVAFMHSSYVPLAIGLAGTGVPVIASEHNVMENFGGRGMEFPLVLLSSLFLKRITLISNSIQSSYPWLIRRKSTVMPDPVRTIFSEKKSGPKENDPKIVLNVGRLESQKDQATLIAAFAQIAPKFPDWNLRIIGEGSLRERLEAQVKESDLEGRISLPGATAEIDREFAAAEVFALSSRYESFGLATAEAMAHGLPVIGFADCPGTNELIKDGVNGLLVESDDRVDRFAESLYRLLGDKDLRDTLGQNAVHSVEEYAPSKVFGRWEELLKHSEGMGSEESFRNWEG